MSLVRLRRLTPLLVAVALVVPGLVVVSGGPASATTSTVTVPFRCTTSIFNVAYDELQNVPVTISAPAAVPQGDPIALTYALNAPPTSVPVALGNVVMNASASVTGQDHGGGPIVSATASGPNGAPANVAPYGAYPVPATPIPMTLPTVGFTVGNHIDITPAALQLSIVSGDDGIGGGVVSCTPEPSAPYALTVFVDGTPAGPPVDQCTADTGNVNTGSCLTNQQNQATVLAGSLSQAATVAAPNPNSTTIDLGTTTSTSTAQVLTAPLNPVTVTDTRGGSFQWSLTATLTNLVDSGSHTIAKSNVSITPACSSSASGSAPGATAGATQSFGASPVALCTGPGLPAYPAGTTGGIWTVSGPVSLSVPAFQAAGAYTATMTINLA